MTHTQDITSHQHGDFVIVSSTSKHEESAAQNVHKVKRLAEEIEVTCQRIHESDDKSGKVVGVGKLLVSEQSTQTETNEIMNIHCEHHHRSDVEHFKQKLTEVVQMNVGWQSLHVKQEKVIAELQQTIASLQQQQQRTPECSSSTELLTLAATSPTGRSMHPRVVESNVVQRTDVSAINDDDDVIALRRKCIQLETAKTELEFANRSLQTHLETTQDVIKRLEQAVDELSGDLESIAKEKESFIDMLQAQILVYREDFECERRDRERAQGTMADLKTELESLKRNLIGEAINMGLVANYDGYHTLGTAAPVPRYATRPEPIPSNFLRPDLRSRRYETETTLVAARQDHHYGNFEYDEIDCDSSSVTDLPDSAGEANVVDESTFAEVDTTTMMKKSQQVQAQDAKASQDGNDVTDMILMEGTLSCPNCHRRFSRDQHVDLMFHLDACA